MKAVEECKEHKSSIHAIIRAVARKRTKFNRVNLFTGRMGKHFGKHHTDVWQLGLDALLDKGIIQSDDNVSFTEREYWQL